MPGETHERLISLWRLCHDGRKVQCGQAFLSLRTEEGPPLWSCTLRSVAADQRERLEGELRLWAQALDGRMIEGLVATQSVLAPGAGMPAVLELADL
jgi:hypothetical protein